MSNVKNLNVKLNAQIKHVKLKIALNVLLFAKCHTVSLIVKLLSQNVKPFVKIQDVIGNALNQFALNQNAS